MGNQWAGGSANVVKEKALAEYLCEIILGTLFLMLRDTLSGNYHFSVLYISKGTEDPEV